MRRWLAFVGDWAYEVALFLNMRINTIRRRLGFTYWVVLGLGKAKRQEGRQLHQRLRGYARGRKRAASVRRA